MIDIPKHKKLILFDGICNLCNDSVLKIIKNDKKGGLSDELAAFGDLGIVGGSSKNIDNEIEILTSYGPFKKSNQEEQQ